MDTTTPERLGGRYDLLEEMGRGGMGTVYRAHDRLTREYVALKRVRISPSSLMFGSLAWDDTNLARALAREFTVLAGLRHPHIISVLDYGFDEHQQPYYTMTLLTSPQTLLNATDGWPMRRKLAMVMQILEALVYLHRHNILHRDLKPANVLVTPQGEVRVVDFGLALSVKQAEAGKGAGTVGYIAPELYNNQAPSPAGDLWPVGIMMFELLTGVHPFDPDNRGVALINSLYEEPAMAIFAEAVRFAAEREGISPAALHQLVSRLLEKDTAKRYSTASEVLTLLTDILDIHLTESHDAREGFLQAAAFVGRDAELAQLTTALDKAIVGRGAIWLVGGESGVGKSRLLDELSTMARVKGVLVLRGQAVAEGGAVLQVWRDLIPSLALHVTLTEAEAAILKAFAPMLESVLGRTVNRPPIIDPEAALRRACDTLIDVLLRLKRPVLILLEDIHWGQQSMLPLRGLVRLVPHLPMMVVGTFRNDDRPDLPADLPDASVLMLGRLDEGATVELVGGMLGVDAAAQPALIDLLLRETEGNAFFLVETVRALADEAGTLAKVGTENLPGRVLAGGVREVIMRRLARVHSAAQPLLRAASMMGRQLDLEALVALRQLHPGVFNPLTIDFDGWLQSCADAAVVELRHQRWRFSHDKLREAVLEDIPTQTGRVYGRDIALMLEQTKPKTLLEGELAGAMASYWERAGDPSKERDYREHAGRYDVDNGDFHLGLVHYARAVALYAPDDFSKQAVITRTLLAGVHKDLSDYDSAYAILKPLITETSVAQEARWKVSYQLAHTYFNQGHVSETEPYIEAALQGVYHYGSESDITTVLRAAGNIAMRRGDFEQADYHFQTVKSRAKSQSVYADALYGMTQIAIERHQLEQAGHYAEEALTLYEQLGQRNAEAETCNLLGIINGRRENPAAVLYFRRALKHMERSGSLSSVGRMQGNLAIETRKTGDFAGAIEMMQRAIATFQKLDDPFSQAVTMVNLGKTFELDGKDEQADPMVCRALTLARRVEAGLIYPHALIGLARTAQRRGDYERAGRFAAVIEAHSGDARLVSEAKAVLILLPDPIREAAQAAAPDMSLAGVVETVLNGVGGR